MDIKDFYQGKHQRGEVGIEIEVEGKNLPPSPEGWSPHFEGSLRGESCEFVLDKPIMRKSVHRYLARMKRAYKEYETEVIPSTRQSVHVHINVQDLTLKQTFSFMTLFLMWESPLVAWCGEAREDNLFCLKSTTARGLISALEDAATPDTFDSLNTSDLRYSAMNVVSIFKFGSIEFRSLEGTDDMDRIELWVSILLALKDAAKKYDSPADIITDMSALGSEEFANKTLGWFSTVVCDRSTWREDLICSMRELQYLAYQTDWSAFEGALVREPDTYKEEPDIDGVDLDFENDDEVFEILNNAGPVRLA